MTAFWGNGVGETSRSHACIWGPARGLRIITIWNEILSLMMERKACAVRRRPFIGTHTPIFFLINDVVDMVKSLHLRQ